MRIPIWSYDANPSVDRRLLKKSLSSCEADVAAGWLKWIDANDKKRGCIGTRRLRRAGSEPELMELLGHGNLLPFTHVQNKMKKPESINYPIPAVGAALWQSHHPFRCRLVNQIPEAF